MSDAVLPLRRELLDETELLLFPLITDMEPVPGLGAVIPCPLLQELTALPKNPSSMKDAS